MGDELRLRVFWVVHPLLLGLFVAEVGLITSKALKASVPGLPADAPRARKFLALAHTALKLLFSRRLGTLLKALILDGLIHRRLFSTSRSRWIAHILVFGAFVALGALSTITGVVVEILPLMGMSPVQVASIPLLGQLFHADVWWVALLNELLGLVVVVGMGMVIYRRYVRRDPRLRTARMDTVIIAFLALIAISGYPTETFRLLADYTVTGGAFSPRPEMLSPERFPSTLYALWGPQFGFIGYLGALGLGMLRWQPAVWRALHSAAFWLHVALWTGLLYLLPFSRFAHIVASPIVVAVNSMRRRETRACSQAQMQQLPRSQIS